MATRQRKDAGRATKATSRKAASGSVEVVEEAPGLSLDAGMGIVTAVLLVVALVLVDMDRGSETGDGMLFKGDSAAAR